MNYASIFGAMVEKGRLLAQIEPFVSKAPKWNKQMDALQMAQAMYGYNVFYLHADSMELLRQFLLHKPSARPTLFVLDSNRWLNSYSKKTRLDAITETTPVILDDQSIALMKDPDDRDTLMLLRKDDSDRVCIGTRPCQPLMIFQYDFEHPVPFIEAPPEAPSSPVGAQLPIVYFESQKSQLCGAHALNNLLQNSPQRALLSAYRFPVLDASVASTKHNINLKYECRRLQKRQAKVSSHLRCNDKSGNFSDAVLLKGLSLVGPKESPYLRTELAWQASWVGILSSNSPWAAIMQHVNGPNYKNLVGFIVNIGGYHWVALTAGGTNTVYAKDAKNLVIVDSLVSPKVGPDGRQYVDVMTASHVTKKWAEVVAVYMAPRSQPLEFGS